MKLLFWLFVAIDLVALVIGGLLGLAAAGSSRTNPVAALVIPVFLPGLILAAAIGLFLFAQSPVARTVALFIAALPTLVVVGGHANALRILNAYRDESGEVTQFRTASLRAVEGAVTRGDAAAVAAAARGVDLDTPSLSGATMLVFALREFQRSKGNIEVVRALLAAGADPNATGAEPPLQVAIAASRTAGLELVQLLLDAGADPNQRAEFGDPAFFMAGGAGIDVAVLELLLARGADVKLLDTNGKSAVVLAATTRNWRVLALLMQRGAPWRDQHGPSGLPFRTYVENELRDEKAEGVAEVLALLSG